MNSSDGSFDHLSDWSWYDSSWETTPSTDGEYHFDDYDDFSNPSPNVAPIPTAWQALQPWSNVTSAAALAAPQNQQYDFNQAQQVWFVQDTQPQNSRQSVPYPSNRGQQYGVHMRIPHDGATAASTTPPVDGLGITAADQRTYPQNTAAEQHSVAPEFLQALFPSPSLPRKDPPCLYDDEGQPLQKQKPRFEGDIYTSLWIKGEGKERSAFCGFCASWHKLKDSAYWYHLHYSHGIACSSGRPMDPPQLLRWSRSANVLEAFCSTCEAWVNIGKGRKMRTTYWRHAYKCMTKGSPRPLGGSPRRAAAVPGL